ncbi:MAG: hypothetical protein CMH56_15185 [Myxococcales bacterium]|nr:hypothetical protein [Myxococcales bacterium]
MNALEPLKLSHPLQLAQVDGDDEEISGDDDETVNDETDAATGSEDAEASEEELLTSKQKQRIKGFWEKHFAFKMNQNLSKEVDDKLWAFFVGGGCFGCVGGPVWLPMLVIDQPEPDDYLEEGLINWGLHFLVQRVLDAPMIILGLASGVTIPNPLTCVDAWWWMPVNAINIWDDARKNERARARMEEDWVTRIASQTPPASQMTY